MNIIKLKEQTAAEHDRVEQSLPVMNSDLDVLAYVLALQRLYGFVLGWEQWAAGSHSPVIQSLLSTRRRSQLLLADLRHFSAEVPSEVYEGPELSSGSLPQVLGAMYVMEGSTLGGQYIARHLEEVLGLEPGAGNAFFRSYGDRTGSMWRQIKDTLTALPDDSEEQVIHAARVLFHDFGVWNNDAKHSAQEQVLV